MGAIYNNITFKEGQAKITCSSECTSGVAALENLKKATSVRFEKNVVTDIQVVAEELKVRAISQISTWTSFWDKLGSLFFSCFGFKSTAQKVDEAFQVVTKKKYIIDGDEEKESPKKDSPHSGSKPKKDESPNTPHSLTSPKKDDSKKTPPIPNKDDAPKTPVKDESPKTPRDDELKEKEAKAKAEQEAALKAEEEKRAQETAANNHKNDVNAFAVEFVNKHLKTPLTHINEDVIAELDAAINSINEEEKRVACYDYIASLDHYRLAIFFAKKSPHCNDLKEAHGIFEQSEIELIIQKVPGLSAFRKNDFDALNAVINQALDNKIFSKGHVEFLKFAINSIKVKEFLDKGDFEAVQKMMLEFRFIDVRAEISEFLIIAFSQRKRVIKDAVCRCMYDLPAAELYIDSLKSSRERDVAYEELATLPHYENAKKYAYKIQNESLLQETLEINDLNKEKDFFTANIIKKLESGDLEQVQSMIDSVRFEDIRDELNLKFREKVEAQELRVKAENDRIEAENKARAEAELKAIEEAIKRAQEEEDKLTKAAADKKAQDEANAAKAAADKKAQDDAKAAADKKAKDDAKAAAEKKAQDEEKAAADKKAQDDAKAAKEAATKAQEEALKRQAALNAAKARSITPICNDDLNTAVKKTRERLKTDVDTAARYVHSLKNEAVRYQCYLNLFNELDNYEKSLSILAEIAEGPTKQRIKSERGLYTEKELEKSLSKLLSRYPDLNKAMESLSSDEETASLIEILSVRLARQYIDKNDWVNAISILRNVMFTDVRQPLIDDAEKIPDTMKATSLAKAKIEDLKAVVDSISNPILKDQACVRIVESLKDFKEARRHALLIKDATLRQKVISDYALKDQNEIDFSSFGDPNEPSRQLYNKKLRIKKAIDEGKLKEAKELIDTVTYEDVKSELLYPWHQKVKILKALLTDKLDGYFKTSKFVSALHAVKTQELDDVKLAGVEHILKSRVKFELCVDALNLITDLQTKKKLADQYHIYPDDVFLKVVDITVIESLNLLNFEEARKVIDSYYLYSAAKKSGLKQNITLKEIDHLISQKRRIDEKVLDYIVFDDLKLKIKDKIKAHNEQIKP